MHVAARYGVPLANATGIACDGSYVWLVAGGHNAFNHTLAHVELVSSTVDKSYQLENLIEQLGTGVYGIAQLAGSVFIAVSGNTNRSSASMGQPERFWDSSEARPSLVHRISTSPRTGISSNRLAPAMSSRSTRRTARSRHISRQATLVATTALRCGAKRRSSEGLFGGLDVYALTTGAPIGHVTKEDGAEFKQDVDVGPNVLQRCEASGVKSHRNHRIRSAGKHNP